MTGFIKVDIGLSECRIEEGTVGIWVSGIWMGWLDGWLVGGGIACWMVGWLDGGWDCPGREACKLG